MKNFTIVFWFELKSLLRKKTFRITTAIMVSLILLITSIPTLLTLFGRGETALPIGGIPDGRLAIYLDTPDITRADLDYYLKGQSVLWFNNALDLKKAVTQDQVDTGFIVTSHTSYELVVQDRSLTSTYGMWMNETLRAHRQAQILEKAGLDGKTVQSELQSVLIESTSTVLGKDSSKSFATVYIMIMMTFMLIMFYGNNVATYVAREKSDRTMELLITSSDTKSLMVGKVLASGFIGILQALIISGAIFGGFTLNKGNYSNDILDFINLNLPLDNLVVFLAFSLVGYFLFLFIFAAVGALMTKVEDVPAATTLVTLLIMISYFIAMFSLNLPQSLLINIASYWPLTSFMVMFVRYAISSVTTIEVLLSFGLLLITAILMGALSVKIYRFGTLNYGNSTNVFKLIKKALTSDD